MSPDMDADGASAPIDELGPTPADEEQTPRAAAPGSPPVEVPDRALPGAPARRRVEGSREPLAYLEWRVTRAWHAAQAAGERPEPERVVRGAPRRQPDDEPRPAQPTRLVCDPAGRRWAVREVGPNDLFGGESPRWLIFRSAGAERRTSAYPPDWESLPAEALLALLALLPRAGAGPRARTTR